MAGAVPAVAAPQLAISLLSNTKPQFVSGGDVLLRVTGSPTAVVRANGRDVTSAFVAQSDGSLLGLVRGLQNGLSTITADAQGGHAALRVTSHPLTGPVFAGRQQLPFYCETTAFGLDAATQPYCMAPTKITYAFGLVTGGFVTSSDPDARPAGLKTITVNGREIPYVVRMETGTIDRAVYQIAALYDGADPSPVRHNANWNGKLVYTFGGGCNGGYHQGNATGGVQNDLFLSRGYAVASASLNVLGINCGTVLSAEVAMMVKEHVIETYGPVRHTVGWGASGGSMQQHFIADAYPGILDGIVPGASYPDMMTALTSVDDCGLFNRYLLSSPLTLLKQKAILGYVGATVCASWDLGFGRHGTPTGSCDRSPGSPIPPSAIWDPETNPDGVKCNPNEQWVNQLGRDPATGFVRSVRDNVGVQYGLSGLRDGTLTPGEFAHLNAAMGGYDTAGVKVSQRTVADPAALAAAYRSDIFLNGGQGLRATPIIDQRMYVDLIPPIDIHTTEMSFVTRARLLAANGTAANQVIIESSFDPIQTGAAEAYELDAMDRWLTAIEGDGSGRPAQQKVIANKPDDLTDGCYLPVATRISEPLSYPPGGRCGAAYPVGGNPRIVSGEPVSMSTLKCALKPLDFAAYPVTFTAEEQALMRQAFPTGVCDYSRPGPGQQPPTGTWHTY